MSKKLNILESSFCKVFRPPQLNLRIIKPSSMAVFAFVLLALFIVFAGVIYDLIVEPPSIGVEYEPTIKILDSNDISKLEIIETKINKSETEKELSYPKFIHRGVTFTQLGKICLFKTGSRICGNKIYGTGVNKIDFQIIDFPKKKFQWNELKIGVVESSGREQFLQQKGFLHCFYYETYWDGCEMFSWKCKNYEQEQYAKPLINGDNFSIIIDQYLHQISFSINNEKYEVAWNGIPKQVSVFLSVKSEKGNKIKYVNNKKTFF
ncbi:oligosaccharyltransferase complex subunit ostc [Anaeramoeba flamelloides]|uniref:Oligosaccharyltransferase complex subunit ostc n=1 Tax=Anaeramoeba flamelloides TaxID=1746091 RepID=A0ABQ8ZE94_9EUKA|nr:oligosaccharyltransferase complex subunit ostc [Anaeramoeba flamelloides]